MLGISVANDSYNKGDERKPSLGLVNKHGEACARQADVFAMGEIPVVKKDQKISGINKFRKWLGRVREAIGQGMSATNSTRIPQREDKKSEEER